MKETGYGLLIIAIALVGLLTVMHLSGVTVKSWSEVESYLTLLFAAAAAFGANGK